jgi:hypothetical protein
MAALGGCPRGSELERKLKTKYRPGTVAQKGDCEGKPPRPEMQEKTQGIFINTSDH